MLLLLHIVIALAGLVSSTFSVFKPSHNVISASFALVAATITSGTLLVVITHSPILSSCITGLLYTGITLSLIISARHRLAKEITRTKD